MRKERVISIPVPCKENWETMIPNANGKHCSSCSKTVVDFTSSSDEVIIKTLEKTSHLCGRFKTTQLGRPLVLERHQKKPWISMAVATIMSLTGLSSQDNHAQEKPKLVQTDSVRSHLVNGKIGKSLIKTKLVKGTVVDQDSIPLPGTSVVVKGTEIGTHTDFDGNFQLNVKNGDVLVFSYIGYHTNEHIVTNTSSSTIQLQMDEDIMGEMVVVGGYVASSTEYIPTKEEIEAKKKLRELKKSNYFKFYRQKIQAKRAQRKLQRQLKKDKRRKESKNL